MAITGPRSSFIPYMDVGISGVGVRAPFTTHSTVNVGKKGSTEESLNYLNNNISNTTLILIVVYGGSRFFTNRETLVGHISAHAFFTRFP